MLRSSSSVLPTALRAGGRRRSRCLLSLASTSSTGSTIIRCWSGGLSNKTMPNRPPGLEPTRRPLQGRRAHDCIISNNNSSNRPSSSSWGGRPSAQDQELQQQERGGRGAVSLPRMRRLSSTPWWVGGSTSPPAPPGPGQDKQLRSRREQGPRRAGGSRHRDHHHQQGLEGGWASELRGRTANAAAAASPTGRRSRWGGRYGRGAGAGRREGEGKGTSQLVNQSIIRRLASARRSKDWRAALRVLDAVEREERAAEAAPADAARGVPAQRQRQVWCRQGLTSREDAERARTTVYNIVLDVLSARRRWQEAFSLLESMQERGVTADIYTLNSVLKACSSAGQVELLLTLLKEMRSRDRNTSSCSSSSSSSSKRSTGRSIAPLLQAPDVVSFNIALAACARAGEATLALGLLEEMRAASTGGSAGAAAPTATATATATGTGEAGNLLPAPRPNLSSFNSALSACVRGIVGNGNGNGGVTATGGEGRGGEEEEGLLREAMGIFEAMRSGAGGAPSPDISTYKEMINACGRAGRWERALSFVDDAVDDGLELTAPVFCAIITAFGRGGEWQRALSVLYEDMPRYQVVPDKFCYNMALRGCADAGRVKEALEILDDDLSGRRGVNGFSYSSIMDALARQGDSELALRLLREIDGATTHKPNAWHYGAVFLACLKAGDEDGAFSVQSEWRDEQAREATGRMSRASGGVNNSSGRQGDDLNGTGEAAMPPEGEGSVFAASGAGRDAGGGSSAAGAPGDRFEPLDLLYLAAFHADNGAWADCLDVLDTAREVSRSARAAVRARANELLLGRAERGERIGSVGATGVEGAGLASWREVAARNSDATQRADESAKALRGCYEAAVEALGRAGRWQQALEALEEGAAIARKSGLPLDPACFVPALRACCTGGGDSDGDSDDDDDGRERAGSFEAGAAAGAALLEEMEARAGVAPDAWCANVVMEAAVRDEQWSLASMVFDQAEARHARLAAFARHRREETGGDDAARGSGSVAGAGDGDAVRGAAAPGAVGAGFDGGAEELVLVRSGGGREGSNRGPRELRKAAIDASAPTARTYNLALQACAGAASSGEAAAERAVSLVRKMAADPNMAPRKNSIALALQVCATSEEMAAAVEIRRLETEAQERQSDSDFLGQWRQRRSDRLDRPRPQRHW